MTDIRVTYSGLIAFGINLTSIVTGLVFTLIVTRSLSIDEFGTWGLINGIIIYAMIISPIITYWVTREVARGEKTAITAIFSSGALSIIGLIIYLLAAYFVGIQSDANVDVLLFAAVLIPLFFLEKSSVAINLGHKPQAASYGFLAFELTKIPSGLIFVYFLNFGVEGAILASAVAYIIKISVHVFFSRKILSSRIQIKYLKKWIKLFWLPVYRTLPAVFALSDVAIFSIMTGSVTGVAYYTSARTVGFLVNHVRSFNQGLYPKLLQSEKQEFIQENLIKLLYFAFPLIAFSFTFARPALFALNPIYEIAAPIVIVISIRAFLTTINKALYDTHLGMEKIDKDPKLISSRNYLKSKLMLFPTIDNIKQGVYIGVLILLLFILSFQTNSTIELVFYWVLVSLIVEIPITLYMIYLTKTTFTIKIDKISIMKYLLASIVVFGMMSMFIEEFLEYKISIYEFLPHLLSYGIVSMVGYLGITYLIDKRTKILVNAILNEVIGKINKKS
ncbi:hypothetical protein C5F49_00725 [Nitrosopumilus oxyclinae]|uniref:Polysaccharide biosynthesis protein n=1 Tax=Nitrosopumilus oxyclinae TaxID=1959104 RepID=A0A7D5M4D2_9ARCH|nr:hypothetical protein [Nitrosopumilus oxyclinae]QLH04008.1 hypothetical protein C5F49_00725 [Nitrosopumilus oxyclinae]